MDRQTFLSLLVPILLTLGAEAARRALNRAEDRRKSKLEDGHEEREEQEAHRAERKSLREEIKELQARNDRQDEKIDKQDGEITRLRESNAQLVQSNQDKDKTIAELDKRIDKEIDWKQRYTTISLRNNELEADKRRMEAQITALQARVWKLEHPQES